MGKEAIFVQDGKSIDITLDGDVNVGDVVPLGTLMVGVANTSGLTGEVISVTTEGVYTITATTADTVAIGAQLYFDETNRVVTTTATDNIKAGIAMSVKAGATAGVVDVKINA
jgi:predicted RecA/RadA family phage recombinase